MPCRFYVFHHLDALSGIINFAGGNINIYYIEGDDTIRKQSENKLTQTKLEFETYEQFLERTGLENNSESLRKFMVKYEVP